MTIQRAMAIFAFIFAAILAPSSAYAFDEAAWQTLSELGAKLLLAAAFLTAYFSRKRAIGGWLLCYYIHLYGSIVFTSLLFAKDIQLFSPSLWQQSDRYVMFLLSTIPIQVMRIVEVVAATRLISDRTAGRLKTLRWTLLGMVAIGVITVAIDFQFFSETKKVSPDIISLFFSVLWTISFLPNRRRTRLVFIENSWSPAEIEKPVRVLSPEDKKRLNVRAVLAGAGVFVATLLLIALSYGERKPDWGIFFTPFFIGSIAAAIARSIPLRGSNKMLAKNSSPSDTH